MELPEFPNVKQFLDAGICRRLEYWFDVNVFFTLETVEPNSYSVLGQIHCAYYFHILLFIKGLRRYGGRIFFLCFSLCNSLLNYDVKILELL